MEYFFSFWLFLWYFYGTRRGSFPSFQTNEISLGYPAGKLSIVSNNQRRNFVWVHDEEAFRRFKQRAPKFRRGTRRGSVHVIRGANFLRPPGWLRYHTSGNFSPDTWMVSMSYQWPPTSSSYSRWAFLFSSIFSPPGWLTGHTCGKLSPATWTTNSSYQWPPNALILAPWSPPNLYGPWHPSHHPPHVGCCRRISLSSEHIPLPSTNEKFFSLDLHFIPGSS